MLFFFIINNELKLDVCTSNSLRKFILIEIKELLCMKRRDKIKKRKQLKMKTSWTYVPHTLPKRFKETTLTTTSIANN